MRFFYYIVKWSLYLSITMNTAKLCIIHNGITSAINEFQVKCVYFYFKKYILEICDLKMKIVCSLLFSFRYRPTSA